MLGSTLKSDRRNFVLRAEDVGIIKKNVVVYEGKCRDYDSKYSGEPSRSLKTEMSERCCHVQGTSMEPPQIEKVLVYSFERAYNY